MRTERRGNKIAGNLIMDKRTNTHPLASSIEISFMRSKTKQMKMKPKKKTSLLEMTREEFEARLNVLKADKARLTH